MKINILAFLAFLMLVHFSLLAQISPSPAPAQSHPICLRGATLHLGNGKEIVESIMFENGKIVQIGGTMPANTEIIDLLGKHIYPGFIAMNSDIGLEEIEAVRATSDAREVGIKNTNARAIIAYNTDSKITPTVRSNGILMAQIAPKGGLFSGTSSIVQLDAWNYEDAVLVADDALYMNMPDMSPPQDANPKTLDEWKKRQDLVMNSLYQTFEDAIAYQKAKESGVSMAHNLMLDAIIPVLKQEKKLFIRASSEIEITTAVALAQQYKLNLVIVGGQDAYLQTALLKKNNVGIVLSKPHQLPRLEDDAVDLPFRMPKILEDAGIPYCFDMDIFWNERNLPFQAGTAVAYGLTKEQALKALCYYPAQILGIEKRVGSLEVGKEATLIVSEGDVLDMRTSHITLAYIQGRKIDLNNLQKELYEKFKQKYQAVKSEK